MDNVLRILVFKEKILDGTRKNKKTAGSISNDERKERKKKRKKQKQKEAGEKTKPRMSRKVKK